MKCLVLIVKLLTISVLTQLLAATKVLPSNGGLHISISDNETELDLEGSNRAPNDCKKNSTSSTVRSSSPPARKRKVLSDVNAYLTGDLSEEEQLLDPWAFFKNYELGEFAEGDLRISSEVGNRRTFLKKAKFWKEGIVPFFVNEIIKNDNHALTVLLNAMRTISIATSNCVQFIPIDINQIRTYPQLPFLNITGDEQGCFSDIGQSNYENIQSQINLNINQCFLLPGNSLHELLHILGQTHEHMRPDRDQYIRINKTSTIGQRTHLSEIDKKKLNIQYACPKNRKRFKFVDILELYNITADNATINHTHEVNILNTLPEQNKSHTISPQQLGQSNTHLGVPKYTNKSPHTMIFTTTPTTQLSYATPTNYEPFFGNLIEKLSKKPYTSITINGIPYNPNFDLNPNRQTMIPSNNKYIYPSYPSSYNPYRNEFSPENNPSSNLMKYFNSLLNQQPFGNNPYSPYSNVPISSYQIPRYNPTPNFNYISSTYEPITTSYESLFYKSPMINYIQPKPSIQSYLNSYKPTYSIQPKPNPYYPSHFNYNPQKKNPYELLYLNPSSNHLPYNYAPFDEPTKNNDKRPNYETVLTKLTTLKPVPTTPETNVRTKLQFNQHSPCNITSESRKMYSSRSSLKPNTFLNPITTLLRLINPVLNNAKNIMAFELRPPILNRISYIYNQEIENGNTPPNKEKTDKNSPLDEPEVPKDLSNEQMTPLNAIFSHSSYYPNEYPSTYENRRNDIIMEPSEYKGHNWNRVPNRQINHPLVNGINYLTRFINNEYPALQSDDASFETNENTYPVQNNHGQNNPIKYIKIESPTTKTPENDNEKNPLGPKLPDIIKMIRYKNINIKDTETKDGSKILPWKIKSPSLERIPMIIKWNGNGNIHRISYIKNRLPPPKQNPEGGNHLKLNSPNWGRISNENKHSPLNNYFNQFPRNEYPEELTATDPSNIPLYLKALISHVYPETGKNTQYIGNLPYDSLALKSPDLSKEHPSEPREIDKDINEIIKYVINNGYPSPKKDMDDIIKMYQIIKNVYPSPNRDIDEITKVYKILHSGYPSQNRNDKDNGQNPDQTGLLQRVNYKFISPNSPKTSNKTSSGPISYNSQSSTGGVIMNPNEYTRPKLNKVPLELNPNNEFPATEYFIKYFKMNPQVSKSPGLKFTNTQYHPNVEAMRPSTNTNDLKTNPESGLTPEKLTEIIKILGPSINNNGIPTNIPENYERFLEILNPSILKELLSSNQTNIESNDKNPPPSTENDRNISNNPPKSKATPLTITQGNMSVFKTVYHSNNMRKYPASEISFNNGNNFAQPSIELIRNKPISKSESPLKMNNDFIEKPYKSPIIYQNTENLNPLSNRNNQNNPSLPHYFIIPSDHNPTLHRPYSTLKFILNPQKINDDMNPNQEVHSNNDDKNPNQEQSQRVSPLLKNVQRPLPRSNWLEYFITLCNKNKKERNDLYVPNSPKYEQTL
ncbi:uncharacterized protein LOC123296108 [Chrysoperla carnea]|uniref:uncharacterized protein LOC123296108 n=1 Tax=Chrysoperla carnea TaxID=189513 RepID=UPI001D06DE7B|nr:uncharacterized protein LOC123296108 [Chrysoperla carnea]